MSKYANKRFWIDTLDRAVATFAQAAVGALSANATGILDLDFAQVGSVAGLAALVSVLTSVAFRGRGEEVPALPSYDTIADAYADDGIGETVDLDGDDDHVELNEERAAELGITPSPGKHAA